MKTVKELSTEEQKQRVAGIRIQTISTSQDTYIASETLDLASLFTYLPSDCLGR